LNEFIIPEVKDTAAATSGVTFPFERAQQLKGKLSRVFSYHLGCMTSGARFETESILVTGESGTGKSKEIQTLLKRFNESGAMLPNGQPARFAECILKTTQSWKDLGRNTLKAVGYPLSDRVKLTQSEYWEYVVREAKLAGVIGIHYDETQHIFRKKGELDRLSILDSFKTLMKSHEWPLILIFSGVPELDGYLREEPQLYRLLHRVTFNDVELPEELNLVHEIVGNYALQAKLSVAEPLLTADFYSRLVAAAAFRWGLVIKLTIEAITASKIEGTGYLTAEHFIDAWVSRTETSRPASPFVHGSYETIYRKNHPFVEALTMGS